MFPVGKLSAIQRFSKRHLTIQRRETRLRKEPHSTIPTRADPKRPLIGNYFAEKGRLEREEREEEEPVARNRSLEGFRLQTSTYGLPITFPSAGAAMTKERPFPRPPTHGIELVALQQSSHTQLRVHVDALGETLPDPE